MLRVRKKRRVSLTGWAAVRELRGHSREYLRGILYFLPVLLICLVLITTGGIRYDNQRAFLQRMTYEGIRIRKPAAGSPAGDFLVLDAAAAAGEERRGLLLYRYQCQAQVFLPRSANIDYGNTCFREVRTVNHAGTETSAGLKAGEAAVSYDVARALRLRRGDELLLVSADGESCLPVTVREIFATKYKYGEIGLRGTVLLGRSGEDPEAEAEQERWAAGFEDSVYMTFEAPDSRTAVHGADPAAQREDGQGQPESADRSEPSDREEWLSREEELRDTAYLRPLWQAYREEGLHVSLLFPLLGFLLLIRIFLHELAGRFKRREHMIAVWTAQGGSAGTWKRVFFLTEELQFGLSSLLALLLYRYLFVQGPVGEYLRWQYLAKIWLIMTGLSVPVVLLCLHRQRKLWSRIDLARLLAGDRRTKS